MRSKEKPDTKVSWKSFDGLIEMCEVERKRMQERAMFKERDGN